MKRMGRFTEFSNKIIGKLNKLTLLQISVIISVVGVVVFFTGLFNGFIGDDFSQIVSNVPVHSLKNIKLFFDGGTSYNGGGLVPLSGQSFRPLMPVFYSIIYTISGLHTFGYHFAQLLIGIASSVLLYRVFKYTFKPSLSLLLALIFFIHPIDSQVLFAMATLGDALFFFFGILAIWLLLRYKSMRILPLVALSLLFSMLSKETAVVCIIMAALYLFWFSRERLLAFLGIMVFPIALYLALRIHAIGINPSSNIAPIDFHSLSGRLMNVPSIISFYIEKFIFPWKLASGYYWVHSSFSFTNFLLPLFIDILVIGLAVYIGILLRKRATKAVFMSYVFFGVWAGIGILPALQIIPLDVTVSETWFYFPMVGVLGMIGIATTALMPKPRSDIVLAICTGLLVVLGIRTSLRGLDWKNQYVLAYSDIKGSSQDYNAYNTIARGLITSGNYSSAKKYVLKSINILPSYTNYDSLGVIDMHLGDYFNAETAFDNGLKYGNAVEIHENLCTLALVFGTRTMNNSIFINSLNQFPKDSLMWEYLALYLQMNNDNSGAQTAIGKAAMYGQISPTLYQNIINNRAFTLTISNFGINLNIP